MEIKYNSDLKSYSINANRGELEILQIAICSNMSQIPEDMKEERRISAGIGVAIDNALAGR